jgi:hypothetical protein
MKWSWHILRYLVYVSSNLCAIKQHKILYQTTRRNIPEDRNPRDLFLGHFPRQTDDSHDQILSSQPVCKIGLEQRTWILTLEMALAYLILTRIQIAPLSISIMRLLTLFWKKMKVAYEITLLSPSNLFVLYVVLSYRRKLCDWLILPGTSCVHYEISLLSPSNLFVLYVVLSYRRKVCDWLVLPRTSCVHYEITLLSDCVFPIIFTISMPSVSYQGGLWYHLAVCLCITPNFSLSLLCVSHQRK